MSSSKPSSSASSGAGARALGPTSPVAAKKPASKSKQPTTASAAAAGARVDHISAASASDSAASAASASLTSLATQTAYPLLHTPYNPEDDVDEDVDEETLRKQMAELMKEEEPVPRALTLELIRQRTLSREVLESGNQDLISKKLFQLERIYLDGLSLNSIDDCFDLFSKSLTHLYLQRNLLTHTHGFSCLKNLQFLMLADNRIRVVEGLEGLDKLIFLDLSHNLIEVLDTGSADDASVCQLPEGLISLNFRGNPFTQDEDYVEHVVTVSPYLKALDGQRVTNAMRRNFGLEASDDEDDEEDTLAAASSSNAAAASSSSSSAGAQRSAAILAADDDDEEDGDDDDDDDDDGADAADALRAETEEMRKRSQQRTMLYDTKHGVTQATTEQDRKDTLTQIQQEEQAAAAAARSARK